MRNYMENRTDSRFNQIILEETIATIAKAFATLNADCQNGSLQPVLAKNEIFQNKAEQTKKVLCDFIDLFSHYSN